MRGGGRGARGCHLKRHFRRRAVGLLRALCETCVIKRCTSSKSHPSPFPAAGSAQLGQRCVLGLFWFNKLYIYIYIVLQGYDVYIKIIVLLDPPCFPTCTGRHVTVSTCHHIPRGKATAFSGSLEQKTEGRAPLGGAVAGPAPPPCPRASPQPSRPAAARLSSSLPPGGQRAIGNACGLRSQGERKGRRKGQAVLVPEA